MGQLIARAYWRSRTGIVILVFFAVGGFFLLTEHGAHLLGSAPLLLPLLLCVGMHVFMHGGHPSIGHEDHQAKE